MKIDISGIAKINGASLNAVYNGIIEGLDFPAGGFIFYSPVAFSGRLTNAGGVLRLNGCLKAKYKVNCYKCLREVTKTLVLTVSEDFYSGEKNNDDENYAYNGSYIEIDKALADNIILNLPMKQVCDGKCKGLCPKCGADLNVSVCECGEEIVDTRMETLKDFFK